MTSSQEFREVTVGSSIDGRYGVKREIARGAMGIVSEAVHETLRASVAIKTLTHAARDWSSGVPRLMREGRLASLSRHPNVVAVQDAGACAVHGPFVVFEMLEGRSLDSLLIARERLDVALVARLGQQLASALAHVHACGVLHRDLKPANVVVTRERPNERELAKLIDFGIAGVAGEPTPEEPKLTAVDELLGTVEFMAPELLLHESGPTFATDVYSFGVLLYECLTGGLPFPGRPAAVITAHAAGTRPRSPRELVPELPHELDEAILAAIAREPSARIGIGELERVCARLAAQNDAARAAAPGGTDAARRQFTRAPYSAPVRLVTRGGAVDGRTEDISEGGLLVVVTGECGEGESVTVRFPLPTSGRVVTAAGVARWIKVQRGRRAVGIAFESLAEDAAAEIRAFADIMSRGGVPQGFAKTLWTTAGGPR